MPFGQDMRIGWRQTVRTGRNSGKLVEDDGVKADFVVRPKPQDLYLNQTRSTQYDRIASKLAAIGRENGRSYTNCKPAELVGKA